MSTSGLWILALWLLGRRIWGEGGGLKLLGRYLMTLLAFLPLVSPSLALQGLALLGVAGVLEAIAIRSRGKGQRNPVRGLLFPLVILIAGQGLLREQAGESWLLIQAKSWLSAGPAWGELVLHKHRYILSVWVGGLLAVFESNTLVCHLLRRTLQQPPDAAERIDLNRGNGRIIGYLERCVLFMMMVAGQWSSIGFIVAAKALARFRELDNREFAEYFIIGTLSSFALTLLFGLLTRAVPG